MLRNIKIGDDRLDDDIGLIIVLKEISSMELLHQAGETIAQRYRIDGILGEGGSGTTYRAKDLQTGQAVALKALSLRHLSDWKMIELFEREAAVLSQLKHSSIPRYLEYFHVDTQSDRCFYIAQELAPGKSLAALVEKGWHATETSVRSIAIKILEILVYLHQLQPPVIHRDIKPQNIIRSDSEQVFLVDFGAVQQTYHSTLARGSTVVGTFGYMAPEQFTGKAVPATDLYGLGATLLFLLTHRSPAELPTDRLKINFRSHVQISEEFADWLERMLEPDVEERFSTAKEALAALSGKGIISAKSSSSLRWKVVAGVGIATIATVSVLNYFKYPILSFLGFTPRAMYEGIMHGDIETVRYYLDRGVNVNALDFRNHTPLHWAVTNNKTDIAEMLITRGADVNQKYDADGHTVLHMAVQHDTKDMAELLIELGADVNVKDNSGYTPLHLSLWKRDKPYYYGMVNTNWKPSKEVVELLISKGADVHAKTNSGATALQMTQFSRSPELVELLLRHGARE